jgi:predicted NBD/HSP70 family sugar kinase
MLNEKLGIATIIENGTHLAAIGEYWKGVARESIALFSWQ